MKVKEKNAKFRRENPDYHKTWWSDNKLRQMFYNARGRSRRNKLPFDLTLEDVAKMVMDMRCYATGVDLCWDWDGPGNNPWAPSLDQIEAGKGYTWMNTRIVCWAYNQAKGEWPDKIVRDWARKWQG